VINANSTFPRASLALTCLSCFSNIQKYTWETNDSEMFTECVNIGGVWDVLGVDCVTERVCQLSLAAPPCGVKEKLAGKTDVLS